MLWLKLIFLIAPAFSQTYQKAIEENKTTSTQTSLTASDAQVSSALSLQDPYKEIRKRTYQYKFGIKSQNYSPAGNGKAKNDVSYDLAKSGSSYLAGFEIGSIWQFANRLNFAINGQAFFTRQKNSVTTVAKTSIDGELNTTLWSFASQLGYQVINPLRLFALAEFGQVTYAHSSQNEDSRFSKETNFWGSGIGAEFNLTSVWSLQLKHTLRTNIGSGLSASVQRDNTELGALARW